VRQFTIAERLFAATLLPLFDLLAFRLRPEELRDLVTMLQRAA
jgi:hypothetical protein